MGCMGLWLARRRESLMWFHLWVLCLIATALGMFLVSAIGDAWNSLRQHMQARHAGAGECPRPADPAATVAG